MTNTTNYLILPGYGNSDEDHWQTYFEKKLPQCHRIVQNSWDNPVCEDWINTIQHYVSQFPPETIILVSHSLGGIALAHWVLRYQMKIKGAFLVAPPNLETPYIDLKLESFLPLPTLKFPFPSCLIASSNDPWTNLEKSRLFAENWGSKLINIGEAGHINTSSGYGTWETGLELLKDFSEQIS